MSRRYPTAELYEERQRDFYRDGNRSVRSYDELDLELNRGYDTRRSAPDFLRDDYNRSSAGPVVVRDRLDEEIVRGPARRRDVEQDLVIRSRPPPSREVEREEISIRRGEGERRRPREVERDETDITIRTREQSRSRAQSRPRAPPVEAREREVEREEISFRRGGGLPRPREVEFERDEVRFRERDLPRREEREEISFRHEHREESRHGREREVEKDSIVIRGRERSLPPPRSSRGELVAREREELIVRRREPTPPREVIKDQIIIRRRERSPSPVAAPLPPPPPPPPEPEIRPPIIQEIITHHRHIDHGVERARSPTPPPPPPSPPRDEILDISIRRRETRGGRALDEDIIYERETSERRSRDTEITQIRGRSLSAPRRRFTAPVDGEFALEADYYNRKAMERAYPGEAMHGATKDWTIVDVPPGTNRVRMDGIGGGAQEISWQRYNGVRRSKFISGDDEIATDFGMPAPAVSKKTKDMWTEITKDLVLREAIDAMGYDVEETDDFYYVMEYLKYEDVLHLVEISDDIRRKRKSRIRQIEYEREEIRDRRPVGFDDRYYEHEVSFDHHRSRYR